MSDTATVAGATVPRHPYLRYVAASGISLAIDVGLFLALLRAGLPSPGAAGAGYAAGTLCHWWLSSRVVFAGKAAEPGSARRAQQGLFLLTAIAGLASTTAIAALGEAIGADPRAAKLAAIVISFQATYLLRRRIVFA